MAVRNLLLLALACGLVISARAQTPAPLDRRISLTIQNERLDTALDRVARAGGFTFSYGSGLFDANRRVSLRVQDQPVRAVLARLLGEQAVDLRSRGNHLILTRRPPPKAPTRTQFFVEGYVRDAADGLGLGRVSVFERQTLASAVTDPFGYFRLRLPLESPGFTLEIRRAGYGGRSLPVTARTRSVEIRLAALPRPLPDIAPLVGRVRADTARLVPRPEPPRFAFAPDSVRDEATFWQRQRLGFVKALLSVKQLVHAENLGQDTLFRAAQLSFVPYVGTNHALSGRAINRFSVNVLAGYALGLRGLELGGLANLERGDVRGVQAAGFLNAVGGRVRAVQLAGFLNADATSAGGVLAAGFLNAVRDTLSGVALAGFLNVTGGSARRAVQVAGFANIARRGVEGVQVAGFLNAAGGELRGWQVAGFLNTARLVTRGRQVGVFNWADSSQRAPIGVLSYVRRGGFRRLELGADETAPLHLRIRTGVPAFYTLLSLSLNPAQRRWSYGYGIGTALDLRRGWSLQLEATAQQWHRTERFSWATQGQYRLAPVLEKRLVPGLYLAAGPTLNAFYSQRPEQNPFGATRPGWLALGTPTDRWTSWLGAQVGLRVGTR